MVFYLISISHAFICLVSFLLIFKSIKKRGLTMLTLGLSTFLAISTVGLIFSHYINYGEALAFANDGGMVVYKKLEKVYVRQVISHWILLGIFSFAIINQSKKLVFGRLNIKILNSRQWKLIFAALILFAYFRYFILGPGLETLINTDLIYFSAEDAVAARTLVNDNFFGQGAYMASVAAYIILPVLFSGFIVNVRKNNVWASGVPYILVISSFFLLSFSYAFQMRQKSPIVQVILIYLLLHFCRRIGGEERSIEKKKKYYGKAIAGGVFFFLLIVSLYVLVFNMNFMDSMIATVVRIFMVPTATEANYFYIFPDIFAYRGILESFVIRIFNPPGVSGVTIFDVAVAATGNEFSSNASFLAIGWSGFGYIGVVLVSVTLCVGLMLIDGVLSRRSVNIRNIVLALSAPPLFVLNSGSLLDYIGAGGIISPLLLLLIINNSKINSDNSKVKLINKL